MFSLEKNIEFTEKWNIANAQERVNIATQLYFAARKSYIESNPDWIKRYINLIDQNAIEGLISYIKDKQIEEFDFYKPELTQTYEVRIDNENYITFSLTREDASNLSFSILWEKLTIAVNEELTFYTLSALTKHTRIRIKNGESTYTVNSEELHKKLEQMTEKERFNELYNMTQLTVNFVMDVGDKKIYTKLEISPLIIDNDSNKSYFNITSSFNFEELQIKPEEIKNKAIEALTQYMNTYQDSSLPVGSQINKEELEKSIENIFIACKSPNNQDLEV